MIPLLEEMFVDSTDDDIMQDSIPNLIFNDNEEWETVPNSSEIPSDDITASTLNTATAATNSIRNVSTSLISSVLSQFWYKGNQTK